MGTKVVKTPVSAKKSVHFSILVLFDMAGG